MYSFIYLATVRVDSFSSLICTLDNSVKFGVCQCSSYSFIIFLDRLVAFTL